MHALQTSLPTSQAVPAEPAGLGLRVDQVDLRFGGIHALRGVSFEAAPGRITAVIGPNGAGKTSLFNVISGFYKPQRAGRPPRRGHHAAPVTPARACGMARTFQNIALFSGLDACWTTSSSAGTRGSPRRPVGAGLRLARRATEEDAAARRDRARRDRLARNRPRPEPQCRGAALRPAETRGTRPRAGDAPEDPAARRARRRHEPRREPRTWRASSLTSRRSRGVRAAGRARHGHGDGHLQPRRGAVLRPGASPRVRPTEVRRHPEVIEAYLARPRAPMPGGRTMSEFLRIQPLVGSAVRAA